MTRKIAIVGSAESWKDAPFDDPSWEIWSLAWRFFDVPRMDVCFEMHMPDQWGGYTNPEMYLNWLRAPKRVADGQEAPVRVVLQPDVAVAFPACEAFPMDAAKAMMGGRPYFTSSFSYMLSQALVEGVDEIGIWGVDLVVGTEYEQQRPAAEFLLGIAIARGVKVSIAQGSALLRSGFLYGVDDDAPDPAIARLKSKVANYDEKIKELMSQVYALGGAKREAEECVTMLEAQHRGLWSKG